MMRLLFIYRPVVGLLAAVCALLSGSAQATEDVVEPELTVRRVPEFPPASPLTSGTLSVVRATTATDEILMEAGVAQQEEEETEVVPFAVLPDIVRRKAEEQLGGKGDYRAAKYVEQGATMYQVSAIKEGHSIELVLTEDGEIAFETREIPFAKLPAAVQASLRERYPDRKFTTIQSITARAYSATYRDEGGREVELRIEPSGLIQNDGEDEDEAVTSDSPESAE